MSVKVGSAAKSASSDHNRSRPAVLWHRMPCPKKLLHVPAMAHDERLSRERLRLERGEEYCGLGDVLSRRELAVDGLFEHDVLDDGLLGDTERARLIRNLLLDERGEHEARADHVRPHPVSRALLGNDLGEPDESMLGGDVGRLQ